MHNLIRHKNIIFVCLLFCCFAGCKEKEDIIIPVQIKTDSISSISFAVVGDLMCHSTQYNYAKVSQDSFCFDNVYKYVKPIFDTTDFVMGNFESVAAGKDRGYSGYPIFNTPDDFITSLSNAGFDILFTANNHCYDKGQQGLKRTIEVIRKNNMDYSGTYSSKEDSDSIRIYNKDGITFVLLSYSLHTNGCPVEENYKYSVNVIDTNKIKFDLWKAKKLKPDFTIIYYHFGNEYSTIPSHSQKDIVKKTIRYGADLILASHPHVLQPIEIFYSEKSKMDSGFVSYSLGNFISNQRWRYSDCGVVLQFNMVKNHTKDKISFNSLSYLPVWVFKGWDKGEKEYYILPTEKSLCDSNIAFLTKADRDSMIKSLRDTKLIINKYSKTPLLKK